jgi:TolA-binding protein
MRYCLLVLLGAFLLTGCRENQKEDVKELEAREANTASAVSKQTRLQFESDFEDKLSSLRAKLDDAKMRVASASPSANRLLINEISQQVSQLDQELTSIRMQFDQLKTASDEQFASAKDPLRARLEEFRQSYMRFATGRPR